jgi:syntaxin 8
MSTSVEPLQLLYEHILLSLLERKRAPMSGAEPNNRTLHGISRSLDTLHRGIESLEREHRQHEAVEDL